MSYLKKPNGMEALFGSGSILNNSGRNENFDIVMIETKKLHKFVGHPFKAYSGDKFDKMKESVKTLGIIEPIIVRENNNDGEYEILSGHNRTEAARELGIKEVPIRILKDIDDELAMLIVTESNIIQRSFGDLTHSEKAVVIKNHIEACKCQGKRNDLVKAVDELMNQELNSKKDNLETSGELYDMSRRNIARYLRVNYLINDFKNILDNEEIGLYAAVNISYIPSEEQEMIYNIYAESEKKIDIKKSEMLRSLSENKKLTEEAIEEVLNDTPKKKSILAFKNFNLDTFLNKYFSPLQNKKEITSELTSALEILKKLRDGEIRIVEVEKEEQPSGNENEMEI